MWTRGASLCLHTGLQHTKLAHCKHGCYHGRVCGTLFTWCFTYTSPSCSGISVGLHQDCPPERCMEIFQQNPTDIIVVGDEVQIDKILKVTVYVEISCNDIFLHAAF